MAIHHMEPVPFKPVNYDQVNLEWPDDGRHILATFDEDKVIVYQSVRQSVALAAVRAQSFRNKLYKVDWCLQPSFIYAVNMSGWGRRKNHDILLAITLCRKGFEEILRAGANKNIPEVEITWEQDVDLYGYFLDRKIMNIRIKDKALSAFSNFYVKEIADVTAFVSAQRRYLFQNSPDLVRCPEEKFYPLLNQDLNDLLGLDTEAHIEKITRRESEVEEEEEEEVKEKEEENKENENNEKKYDSLLVEKNK